MKIIYNLNNESINEYKKEAQEIIDYLIRNNIVKSTNTINFDIIKEIKWAKQINEDYRNWKKDQK